MVIHNPRKSRHAAAGAGLGFVFRTLPRYGIAGLLIMLAGEVVLFAGAGWIARWFTPIMWTGYILLVDGVILSRKGTSLLSRHPREFAILAVISIASWEIFEGYNVLLQNWRYTNLPESFAVRLIGYAWSFATISPGMFLTYELLEDLLPGENPEKSPRLSDGLFYTLVIFGLACVVVPLIWPSPHMTPLVWIGWAFFLDPINQRLGERSFVSELFSGKARAILIMFLAGLVCGILWEFWNFWAATKWEYHVPYLGHIKIFEMPVLGFLGFLPFAVESYAIYIFLRRLIPIKRQVRYLG
jgi:hypothetical protein